jgi:hypothetical protein
LHPYTHIVVDNSTHLHYNQNINTQEFVMKKLIIASLLAVASLAASAEVMVIQWTAPSGNTYTYYLDTGSARNMETTVGPVVTAEVDIMNSDGVLMVSANVVATGCGLAEPAGKVGLVDRDNVLIAGTKPTLWSMARFHANSNNIADILASNTCIAAMANSVPPKEKGAL